MPQIHHIPGYLGSLASLCCLLLLAVVGLPIFAVHFHRSGRHTSERLQRLGGSPLLGLYLMEYGYWLAQLPLRAARRIGATPDVVTMAGLTMVLAASAFLGAGWFALGGWLLIVGFLLDTVDGQLARETDRCSDAGEYLDAIVDRYTEIAVLAGLTIYYRDHGWAMAIVLGALGGSVMVSYARAKAEALDVHDAPGWLMRRHERSVYIGFGVALAPVVANFAEPGAAHPVYYLALVACGVVAVLSNIAALKLIVAVRRALKSPQADAGTPTEEAA